MARESMALVVDRIACDGHGVCAELIPERIELDDWGYPIVMSGPIPDHLLGHAERAVRFCPVLALRLRPAVATYGTSQPMTPVATGGVRPAEQRRPPRRNSGW